MRKKKSKLKKRKILKRKNMIQRHERKLKIRDAWITRWVLPREITVGTLTMEKSTSIMLKLKTSLKTRTTRRPILFKMTYFMVPDLDGLVRMGSSNIHVFTAAMETALFTVESCFIDFIGDVRPADLRDFDPLCFMA